nr:MAG TPA: hypothetical protein [Caudoviricetes sp.]
MFQNIHFSKKKVYYLIYQEYCFYFSLKQNNNDRVFKHFHFFMNIVHLFLKSLVVFYNLIGEIYQHRMYIIVDYHILLLLNLLKFVFLRHYRKYILWVAAFLI